MTMDEAIQEFGFDCKIRKLSPKTIDNYRKQLKYLYRYLKSEFQIEYVEEIKPFHIKQFLSYMDDRGRKARYHNNENKKRQCNRQRGVIASLLSFRAS